MRDEPSATPEGRDPASFMRRDYRIRIECPLCGGPLGVIEKLEDQAETVQDDLDAHGHADRISWPARQTVDNAIAKLLQKPITTNFSQSGPGAFNGRSGRVRATKRP